MHPTLPSFFQEFSKGFQLTYQICQKLCRGSRLVLEYVRLLWAVRGRASVVSEEWRLCEPHQTTSKIIRTDLATSQRLQISDFRSYYVYGNERWHYRRHIVSNKLNRIEHNHFMCTWRRRSRDRNFSSLYSMYYK